jgi:membrane protease YdiL (CAAX protease family)
MVIFLKIELGGIWEFLKRNANEVIIIAAAMLFITLDRYHPIGPNWLSSLLYYGLFPIVIILLVLRKNPLDFGLRWGEPRIWGWYVLIICVIAAVILVASTSDKSLQGYYGHAGFNTFTYALSQVATLGGQAFMFRGFLLFGLSKKFGEASILIQTLPFVAIHWGKPEIETLSTIITGILFGWVAYRGKSYWPVLIIHLFINIFFVALVNFRYPVAA